jgi:hypothetical protein
MLLVGIITTSCLYQLYVCIYRSMKQSFIIQYMHTDNYVGCGSWIFSVFYFIRVICVILLAFQL